MNRLKNRNHRIISIVAEKTFGKIQHPFIIKTQEERTKDEGLEYLPRNLQLTYLMVRNEVFLLRSGRRQGCALLLPLFNIILENLFNAVR